MNTIIEDNKDQFEKTIEFLKENISSLRTGRVSPSLVESIMVESYGTKSELVHLAAINTPEPRSISIKPWDKGILKDIERALMNSDLNVNPVVDEDLVRLNFPQLTEESRKELVKVLHKKLEESRISLRNQRDKIKESIISIERAKEISEDEKFTSLKELDDMTRDYNEKIKVIGEEKEKEIMTI